MLGVSACGPSRTDDPARPDPATTTFGTALSVRLEHVATYDQSTIPGLQTPGYMAFDSQGQLHVVNSGNSEILVLDSNGRVVRRWGELGTRPGQFDFRRDSDPSDPLGGIAVAADGSVYVVESGAKRVQRLTAGGRPLASWGTKGRNDGQFLEPIGVAVAPSGEVFVVDDERDDIQGFSADGSCQFTEPQDVAFGPDGRLLVVDHGRVQVFDAQRNLVGVWEADPSADKLGALALDGDHLWVEAPYTNKLFALKVSWTS